jgi:hypothetical protein
VSFGRGLVMKFIFDIIKDKIKKLHDFLINCDKVKAELYWIKKLWYIILLVLSTKYVITNFTTLTNQCFGCHFNGNSIIFILWIILLILPLIDSIEGYGFKFNKEKSDRERQTKELHDLSDELVNRDNYSNIAELNSLLRNLRKENKDE